MYYNKSPNTVIEELNSSVKKGLSSSQVQELQQKHGKNELPELVKETKLQKFFRQFTNILVVILILAAVVSFVLHEYLDGIVILIIVLANGILGYVQEARAEKAIEALKGLSTHHAKVIRNGQVELVEVKDLVIGDILLLEDGDKIGADARLIEVIGLEVSESVLTGESLPVKKQIDSIEKADLALGDRKNMVYKDTNIVSGRGKAVVVAIGQHTEIGKISKLLQKESDNETPLGKELDIVGKRISMAALIVISLIFVIGYLIKNLSLQETFLTSVSLAVAAIPEGLPAVVTISLALGVSRLAKKKAIVRRLQAVETLGSTNFILTDKTGTLTQNKMTVTNISTLDEEYVVATSSAKNDKSKAILNKYKDKIDLEKDKKLKMLIINGLICNDADFAIKNSELKLFGDSTETALIELAYHLDLDIEKIRNKYERIHEIPFNSVSKKMLVVVKNPTNPEEVIVMAKGASEIIANMVNTKDEDVMSLNKIYAQNGLRSLAFSYKKLSLQDFNKALKLDNPEDTLSTFHTFLGVMAQKDPVRSEVKHALKIARDAGIKTIMITGDHKLTATSIGIELGLITDAKQSMDGIELGDKTGKELLEIIDDVHVFARVSPQQKLNIVEAVKKGGFTTAVTGDGVNDAPAIKTADIGISMGITGTDVTKEVSDLVLQDDNYATIIEAVRQGRIIYDNLVKFITYLISCNISEILIITVAMLSGPTLPLLPIQILWLNLVTDGLPAIALGMEPGEKDIMSRAPRGRGHLLNKKRWTQILYQSSLITVGSLIMFRIGLGYSTQIAQTATLTTLALAQLFHSYNSRSEIHSIFSSKLAKNGKLFEVVIISIIIQMAIVYTSVGNTLLKTTPISLELLAMSFGFALIPVIGTEIYKAVMQLKNKK